MLRAIIGTAAVLAGFGVLERSVDVTELDSAVGQSIEHAARFTNLIVIQRQGDPPVVFE